MQCRSLSAFLPCEQERSDDTDHAVHAPHADGQCSTISGSNDQRWFYAKEAQRMTRDFCLGSIAFSSFEEFKQLHGLLEGRVSEHDNW
jgi:hypothetical protein